MALSFPLEYCHTVWYRKTRMVDLPEGGKSLKIYLFVLTQSTNLSDRQTDTHRNTQTPYDGIGSAYAWHRAAKTALKVLYY